MKLLIIILTSFFLTGCYNYHELNNIAIASSIIFDYEDDCFQVMIQINSEEDNDIIKGEGKTVSEALNKANIISKKKISFYHLKTVFITPKVNIEKILLYLIRDPQVNNSFYIVYTEDNKIIDDNKDKDVGTKIYEMLSKEFNYTFFDLSTSIYNDNIDFYLPIINKDLHIDGIMPYDSFQSTKALSFDKLNILKLLNEKEDSYIYAKCDDGMIEVRVNNINTKIKINKKVNIDIDLKVSIIEYDSNIKNYDTKGIMELEGILNSEIKELVWNLIKELQDDNSDILGIDRYIYNDKHHLKYDWKDYDYNIDIDTKINKKGLVLE